VLAALGAVSVFVTPFSTGFASSGWVEIPRSRAGWEGEDLSIDRALFGRVGQALYRRYERPRRDRPPQSVELFLGYEVPESPVGDRLFSRRTSHPGPGWSLEQTRQRRLWTLGVDADLAVASRDSELALVYSWRVRDGGIWGETPRSVLGLERGPFRRERRRVVVRLVTPLRSEGPVAFDRAKRTLDRFIIDFGDELARL
jgi:hypothetical protein